MNIHTQWVAEAAKCSLEEAVKIQDVIDSQWLIERWSEATNAKIKRAVKLAQFYIANNYSWE